eukprot:14024936-Ditylum_brightwellii.AAC.1
MDFAAVSMDKLNLKLDRVKDRRTSHVSENMDNANFVDILAKEKEDAKKVIDEINLENKRLTNLLDDAI